MRAVHSIDRSEQRILALRFFPTPADGVDRERHAIRGLVTSYAGASVFTDGLEKRMARGDHRPRRVQHTDAAGTVRVTGELREDPAVSRRPPVAARWFALSG